jgi:hypothetical protein
MSTIETLEDRANILTTSLDVVLTYISKYSENHVVSGQVARLYAGIRESFEEDYHISARRAHLLLIWGYTPEPAQVVSAAYYLYRHDIEGPFTRLQCVKSIGVKG